MIVKTIEIHDVGTQIGVIVIKPDEKDPDYHYFKDAGYDRHTVLVTRLDYLQSNYDPYCWKDRTMRVAHQYILGSFKKLKNNDVVDVEIVLGLKDKRR